MNYQSGMNTGMKSSFEQAKQGSGELKFMFIHIKQDPRRWPEDIHKHDYESIIILRGKIIYSIAIVYKNM